VKLVIHEDVGIRSNPKEYLKEAILSGNSSILNLDKDHSKLFIGGLPATFNEQSDIVGQSLEGRVEDLMLGNTFVGLWNFVDSSGVNNGSIERYSQIIIFIY
jgi:laminin alpha 3/5